MKKKFLLLAMLFVGLSVSFMSCGSDDDENVIPVNPIINVNSLAGQSWTLVEDEETSTFTFLTDALMSVLVSPTTRTVTSPTTYTGSYVYNKASRSAVLNYNGRSRSVANISITGNKVECMIDGTPVEMTVSYTSDVTDDKEFLEATGKEFVGLFNKNQFKSYSSIYHALKDSKMGDVDDELGDIIDNLKELVYNTPTYKMYKITYYAAAFKGKYKLNSSNNTWYKTSYDGHRIEFKDKDGRDCVLEAKTSGEEKNVYLFDDETTRWEYDYSNYPNISSTSYKKKESYYAKLPEHIECTLTQGGTQLIKAIVDVDLSGVVENQKFNPSRNSVSMKYTLNLRDLVNISAYTNYVAQGTSKAGYTVTKNGRTIMTAAASANTALTSTSIEDFDEDDKDNLNAASINIDILGKIQLKGDSRSASNVIKAFDQKSDSYNYESMKKKADKINGAMSVKMYYNGTSDARAFLNFAVDSKEVEVVERYNVIEHNYDDWSWNEYVPVYTTKTKYDLTSAINFSDGTSYFVEKYFTEDAFKSLVDMFNGIYDDVEAQFED